MSPARSAERTPSARRKRATQAGVRRRHTRLRALLTPGARSDLPAYMLLARHLQSQIEAGRYPVASLLPTEMELCARYGLSRYTVREALRRLHEEGLVERHQGVGTYVRAERSQAFYLQHLGSIADLLQYTQETYLEIAGSQRVRADGALARLLGCPRGAKWVRLQAVRREVTRDAVVCLVDIYLRPAFEGIERELGGGKRSIYGLIEARSGRRIAEIEQTIVAELVQDGHAATLNSRPGQPALKTVRRFYDEQHRLLEVSVSIHPADTFTYAMRLRRDTNP